MFETNDKILQHVIPLSDRGTILRLSHDERNWDILECIKRWQELGNISNGMACNKTLDNMSQAGIFV